MRDYKAKYDRYLTRIQAELHPKTTKALMGWIDSVKMEYAQIKMSSLAGYIEKMYLNARNFKEQTGKHLHEIDKESYKQFKLWLNEHYNEYTNSKRLNDWLDWWNDEKDLDIHKIKNKSGKEPNSKDDAERVLYWEDILKVVDRASTPMTRAMIAIQGECGMRPGELIGLKWGDLILDDKGAKLRIQGIKNTGMRFNRLNKSLPFIVQWFENHPLKGDEEAPMWLSKGRQRGQNRYYKDTGWRYLSDGWLTNVFEDAGLAASLKNKKVNPNWFRHSSVCTKIWNGWTPQESADWHGHSIETSQKVYQEKLKGISENRMLQDMGQAPKEVEAVDVKFNPKHCPFCGGINHYNAKACLKCSRALSLEEAIRQDKEKDAKLERMEKQIEFLMHESGLIDPIVGKGLPTGKFD